jgi:hypothetical protein
VKLRKQFVAPTAVGASSRARILININAPALIRSAHRASAPLRIARPPIAFGELHGIRPQRHFALRMRVGAYPPTPKRVPLAFLEALGGPRRAPEGAIERRIGLLTDNRGHDVYDMLISLGIGALIFAGLCVVALATNREL